MLTKARFKQGQPDVSDSIIVTDAQLTALNIVRDPFHGEWNSIIKPQDTPSL